MLPATTTRVANRRLFLRALNLPGKAALDVASSPRLSRQYSLSGLSPRRGETECDFVRLLRMVHPHGYTGSDVSNTHAYNETLFGVGHFNSPARCIQLKNKIRFSRWHIITVPANADNRFAIARVEATNANTTGTRADCNLVTSKINLRSSPSGITEPYLRKPDRL